MGTIVCICMLVGVKSLCEPFCVVPCAELNGDWRHECADCGAGYACRARNEEEAFIAHEEAHEGAHEEAQRGLHRAEVHAWGAVSPELREEWRPSVNHEVFSTQEAVDNAVCARRPCMYMYPQADLLRFLRSSSDEELRQWAFGRELEDGMYEHSDGSNFMLNRVLLYRLYTEAKAEAGTGHLTSAPEHADLFLMPLVPQQPPYHAPSTAVKAQQDLDLLVTNHPTFPKHWGMTHGPLCRQLWTANFGLQYAHLNDSTAPRHVILATDYSAFVSLCQHRGLSAGLARSAVPRSRDLLQAMRWIFHEHLDWSPEEAEELADPLDTPALHLHIFAGAPLPVINVPFAGIAHSARPLELVAERHAQGELGHQARPYLMSFGGSLSGMKQSVALRKRIWEQCRKVGEPTCKGITAAVFNTRLTEAYRIKQRSVFCLEPGGWGPIRKAILDSLLLGCIPVVFVPQNTANALWPWHWGPWRADSSVRVEPQEFLQGRVDLHTLLSSIPPERVAHMQRTMQRHAMRLVYFADAREAARAAAVTSSEEETDAYEILLHGLAFGVSGVRRLLARGGGGMNSTDGSAL